MIQNIEELYFNRLRDLYSAEDQLSNALPRLMIESSCNELRTAFGDHLEETERQKARLERLCARHLISPGGESCESIRGMIREAEKHVLSSASGEVRDALLVVSMVQFEHYEVAAYRMAKRFAEILGFHDDAELLSESLSEECRADEEAAILARDGIFSET